MIYTKNGDRGMTSLYGGIQLSKADLRVEAYGNVDELSAWLGMVLCEDLKKGDRMWIVQVQENLYICMCLLAGAPVNLGEVKKQIQKTESMIDKHESKLPKLRNFILPKGTKTSVTLHVASTVCRRAERAVVRADLKGTAVVVQYLNRLSDALFILSLTYTPRPHV